MFQPETDACFTFWFIKILRTKPWLPILGAFGLVVLQAGRQAVSADVFTALATWFQVVNR